MTNSPKEVVMKSTKIDWKKQDEIYQFTHHQWDIDLAKEILSKKSHEQKEAEVNNLEPMLQMVHINWQKVEEPGRVDLSIPLIFGWLVSEDKKSTFLIDGHHRVAKASKLGIDNLPCYILTKNENKRVHIKASHFQG